jgi:hypothetical protein
MLFTDRPFFLIFIIYCMDNILAKPPVGIVAMDEHMKSSLAQTLFELQDFFDNNPDYPHIFRSNFLLCFAAATNPALKLSKTQRKDIMETGRKIFELLEELCEDAGLGGLMHLACELDEEYVDFFDSIALNHQYEKENDLSNLLSENKNE